MQREERWQRTDNTSGFPFVQVVFVCSRCLAKVSISCGNQRTRVIRCFCSITENGTEKFGATMYHKICIKLGELRNSDTRTSSGRPSTSKTGTSGVSYEVRRRLTLRLLSSELNMNAFTLHQILTQNLGISQDGANKNDNRTE